MLLGFVRARKQSHESKQSSIPRLREPWKNSGMSQAEFTVTRLLDLYDRYLNSGFRAPLPARIVGFRADSRNCLKTSGTELLPFR